MLTINHKYKSKNFNQRKDKINSIIIHYTDTKDVFEAIDILTNQEREVSAHYVIDTNGEIYQLVDEKYRAWHAGVSKIEQTGQIDVNSVSIGIELQNGGVRFGYHDFPQTQITSLQNLIFQIKSRHNIDYILGHDEIAKGRKIDPGDKFPWDKIR